MVGKCLVLICVGLGLLFWIPASEGADSGKASPRVIKTIPKNGGTDVDPSLGEIRVSFSRPMLDKSWSWSYEDKDTFPEVTGESHYTDDGTTCVLPVKLQPGKQYVIWINTARLKNFKDRSGTPAEPYRLTFMTRQE
jgi:hypothetical protein